MRYTTLAALALVVSTPICAVAQGPRRSPAERRPPPRELSLPAAIARGADGPVRRSADADAEALRATSDAARMALLPSLSASAQIAREAANVAPGASWGNEGVPAISGPPFEYRFDEGVWITQAGLGASFGITELLRRVRALDASVAEEAQAAEARRLGRLDRAVDVAASFLTLRAAELAREVLEDALASITALGEEHGAREDAELEGLLIGAERRALELQVAMASESERVARVRLAGMLGLSTVRIRAALPEGEAVAAPRQGAHPALRAADSAVRASELRAEASRLELLPRVELLAALWGRGSGLPYPGQSELGSATGLLPERPGWAVGLSVTWRLLDLPAVEARSRAADARARGERARRELLLRRVRAQAREAWEHYRGTVRVVAARRESLEAAEALSRAVEARVRAGERPLGELLAVRRLRLNAALEHRVGPVATEQARLLVARALGDLEPFLARYR